MENIFLFAEFNIFSDTFFSEEEIYEFGKINKSGRIITKSINKKKCYLYYSIITLLFFLERKAAKLSR